MMLLYFAACGGGDYGLAAAFLDLLADGRTVVALVAEHLLGIVINFVHQCRKGGDIVGLARRDHDADRQALCIGAGIDLGREAAARTAERIALGAPFPPAAQ